MHIKNPQFTQKDLQELFYYDGTNLLWKERGRGRAVGKIAGFLRNGYRIVIIKGINYRTHRLIWMYQYGEWPNLIDHINRKRADNRLCNLRNADSVINNRNCGTYGKSGIKGVTKRRNSYIAYIGVGTKQVYLGSYATAKEAIHARRQGELWHWGGTDKSVTLF